ncbi:MAG: carbon starvation protein A, partial [Oscillospiraceae bacterium]|nr:carbon starvation protein A [Oscillospiraceae bacterium]
MAAIILISVTIAILVAGYILYGNWLVKEWGVDPAKPTPAVTMSDGVDYVPARPAVLMGHHFPSIAGAGPINGPIQASVFGWVPVFLWCVLGGIFFGGLHDFGSLFASIRHQGKGMGEIVKDTMGKKAGRLFTVFALLVLILVIASFVNVVAGTFFSSREGVVFAFVFNPSGNETTAMVSIFFILLSVFYGQLTSRMGVGT